GGGVGVGGRVGEEGGGVGGPPAGGGVVAGGGRVPGHGPLPQLVVLQVADRLEHRPADPDLGAGEGLRRRAVVLGDDVGVVGRADALIQQRGEVPDRLLARGRAGGVYQRGEPGGLRRGGRGAAEERPAPGGGAAVELRVGGDEHIHAAIDRRVPRGVGGQGGRAVTRRQRPLTGTAGGAPGSRGPGRAARTAAGRGRAPRRRCRWVPTPRPTPRGCARRL